MKEKTNIFKKFFRCLYDVTAFPKYARQGILSAILYIVTLVLILGTIKGVFFVYKSNFFIDKMINVIQDSEYSLYIDNQRLNIQGLPITVENNNDSIVYINSDKSLSQESELNNIILNKNVSALVLNDGIIFRKNNNEYTLKYSEVFDESRFENEELIQKLKSFRFTFTIAIIIENILITYIDLFWNLAIVILISGIISMIMRMVIKYKALISINIYASTLPLIVFSILQMLYAEINFDLVFIMGTLTYLIITLSNIRIEIIEKIKSGKI